MDLHQIFIMEADELLFAINDEIVALEANPADQDLINTLFRATHTLKGSANLSGYVGVGDITHTMETILGYLREGVIKMGRELTDLLLQGFDEVRRLITLIVNGDKNPLANATVSEKLRAYLEKIEQDNVEQGSFSGDLIQNSRIRLHTIPVHVLEQFIDHWMQGNAVWRIMMELDEQLFFGDKDPLMLLEQLELTGRVVHVQLSSKDWPVWQQFDPFKCYLDIDMYVVTPTDVDQQQLEKQIALSNGSAGKHDLIRIQLADLMNNEKNEIGNLFEDESVFFLEQLQQRVQLLQQCEHFHTDILTDIQQVQVALQQVICHSETNPTKKTLLLHLLMAVMIVHTKLSHGNGWAMSVLPWWSSFWSTVSRCLYHDSEQSPTATSDLLLDVWELCMTTTTNDVATTVPVETSEELADDVVMDETQEQVAEQPILPVPPSLPEPTEHETNAEALSASSLAANFNASRMLRIEPSKIDRLMELAGELTIVRNGLQYMVRKLQNEYHLPEVSQELKVSQALLDRVAKELQHAIVDVRMLPIANVFGKYNRFIRDVSQKLNKQIRLEIVGDDTTIDKNLVEALSEPMLHLVRNAIDHGLEGAEERIKNSKPAIGTLTLLARREAHHIYIEVSDDGRGIDVEKIKQKVRQLGLVTEEQLLSKNNEELLQFIFHPGFSTSTEITSLSGRGVGMDAVLRGIQSIQGKVRVASQLGVGTTIQLELPMNVTMTEVLQVKVCDAMYGLPLDHIEEIVKIPQSDIQTMAGEQVVLHRNKLLPVVVLSEYFGLQSHQHEEAGHTFIYLIILKSGICLKVDGLAGKQEIVMKQLDGSLNELTYLMGAAIVGDGSVLLIVDGDKITKREGVM